MSQTLKLFAVRFGLACCACLLADQATQAGTQVSFRLLRERLIVVAVTLDGAGPFDFLLDTGTNTTLLTPRLAGRFGLRPTGSLEIITAAGSQHAPRALLGSLAVGAQVARDVEVLVCELPALHALDGRIIGVLGQNFLSRFNYTLDYGRRRVEFSADDETPAAMRGTRFELERDEGLLFLQAQPGAARARGLRLLLDTASASFALFDTPHLRVGLERCDAPVQVTTNAGSSVGRSCRLPLLRLGDHALRDLPVALLPADSRRAEDGLLPLSLFRRVYINNAQNFMLVSGRFSH